MRPSDKILRGGEQVSSTRPGGYDKAVTTTDRTIAFLYTLIRDHMPAGMLEEIITEMEEADARNKGEATEYLFSNDFVAAYAVEIAARLRGEPRSGALVSGHEAMFRAHQQGVRNSQLKRPEDEQR